MSYLKIQEEETFVTLKINRPDVLNALNKELLKELLSCLLDLRNTKLKALILTGEGPRSFIAGADIKAMSAMDHLQMMEFCQLGQQVSLALEKAPFVTIAAVNGYALGGGLEMALACDFIYASQSAKMGLPEITLGIIPGFGGTQRLARAIGTRQAKEMIMTGKMVTAEEAKNLGIVNKVYPPELLMEECQKTIQNLSKYSLTAIRQAKHAINEGISMGINEALEFEKNLCAVCFATQERVDGMQAFLSKKG